MVRPGKATTTTPSADAAAVVVVVVGLLIVVVLMLVGTSDVNANSYVEVNVNWYVGNIVNWLDIIWIVDTSEASIVINGSDDTNA